MLGVGVGVTIIPVVGIVIVRPEGLDELGCEVAVEFSWSGVQDTPAASLSKQNKASPDAHSNRLLSVPVHSQSLVQMLPAPSPKCALE